MEEKSESEVSDTEESKGQEDPEITRIKNEMDKRKAEALAPKVSPNKRAAPEPEEVRMKSPETTSEDEMGGMEDDDLELSQTMGKHKKK